MFEIMSQNNIKMMNEKSELRKMGKIDGKLQKMEEDNKNLSNLDVEIDYHIQRFQIYQNKFIRTWIRQEEEQIIEEKQCENNSNK